jgi:hypothetical protein
MVLAEAFYDLSLAATGFPESELRKTTYQSTGKFIHSMENDW